MAYNGQPIKFSLRIDGMDLWDRLWNVDKVFIGLWNNMAKLCDQCEITEAYQKVFDTYFPNEGFVDESLDHDNAYVTLYEKMTKEICDKLSPTIGKLPTGKVLYIAEHEPILFNPETGEGWLTGYMR